MKPYDFRRLIEERKYYIGDDSNRIIHTGANVMVMFNKDEDTLITNVTKDTQKYYNGNGYTPDDWIEIPEVVFSNYKEIPNNSMRIGYDFKKHKGYILKNEVEGVKITDMYNEDGEICVYAHLPVYRKDVDGVMHPDTFIDSYGKSKRGHSRLEINHYPHTNNVIPEDYGKYLEEEIVKYLPEYFI